MAKKLTQRDANGKLKVVGFNPFPSWYENVPAHFGAFVGRDVDGRRQVEPQHDPPGRTQLKWQKSLIDWYGYDNLVRFNAGAGDEFSASNAFETGKVAMHMDGEWRVAFIKRRAPGARLRRRRRSRSPTTSPELYGAGYITGSIIGIPKTSKHKDQAWLLVKYLGTNSAALAKLSNGIQNVPTTTDSLKSPALAPLPQFQTFLDVFGNAEHDDDADHAHRLRRTRRPSRASSRSSSPARRRTSRAGLPDVDKQIDAQLKQAEAGQAP